MFKEIISANNNLNESQIESIFIRQQLNVFSHLSLIMTRNTFRLKIFLFAIRKAKRLNFISK